MAKFERKTLKKTVETPEEQEQALAVLRETAPIAHAPKRESAAATTPKIEKTAKQSQRVNLDLPLDVYEAIQEHIKRRGQTMKGFFVLAAAHFMELDKK